MNLLILSGNAKINKEWSEEVGMKLKDMFDEIEMPSYLHWEDEDGDIDLDAELDRLDDAIGHWDEYVVFAKSAGSLLTLKAISEGIIAPNKCVFIGFPFKWAKKKGYEINKWIEDCNVPVLFIQKEKDWVGGFDEMLAFLSEFAKNDFEFYKYKVNGEPDDDHHYADTEYLKVLFKKFIDES